MKSQRKKNLHVDSSKFSAQARSLWAKSPNKYSGEVATGDLWLPLHAHMLDSAEVAKLLWEYWVPPGTKRIIHVDSDIGRRLLVFLAAAHDIGKATPVFQIKVEELAAKVEKTLPLKYNLANKTLPHAVVGHVILSEYFISHGIDFKIAETYAVVVGGHHGKPPTAHDLCNMDVSKGSYDEEMGYRYKAVPCEEWKIVQQELLEYALRISGLADDFSTIAQNTLSAASQAVLTGLVIMTDWIASSFDLIDILDFNEVDSAARAREAWHRISMPPYWHVSATDLPAEELFAERFCFPSGAKLRPVQLAAVTELRAAADPGIAIIEAPMGEGKTEAALAAAEILAARHGKGGVFMALPTQATSNGIFKRIKNWINRLPDNAEKSVFLAHGKADLNDEYAGIRVGRLNVNNDEDNENTVVNTWLRGRKRGILSDFVIGTVDQVLMGALQSKHLALRHLGLANKVIVVDECHAYDAYMVEYLYKALRWLGEYGVPVVVLSATLPSSTRKRLVDAYLGIDSAPKGKTDRFGNKTADAPLPVWAATKAYPLITFTDGKAVRSAPAAASGRRLDVKLQIVENDDILLPMLYDLTADGGCVGIIRNTVRRAQEIAEKLTKAYGEENVLLIHSAFVGVDRIELEEEIRKRLGPGGERPHKLFVVGTQVLEQSLDIDFDLLCSDLCPMDLLIQRIGREHRHTANKRPPKLQEAKCLITGAALDEAVPIFDGGAEYIYGRYHLYTTTSLILRNNCLIQLPADIPEFVQDAYAEGGVNVPAAWRDDYEKAKCAEKEKIEKKRVRAKGFQIADPGYSLVNWFGSGDSIDKDVKAEAAVRDTNETLEVMVVQRFADGILRVLPWIKKHGGAEIPRDFEPSEEIAKTIASCSVMLPVRMSKEYNIDHTISELEQSGVTAWQKSYWLQGALILILDEHLSAVVNGFSLQYNRRTGLSAE